MLPRVFCDTFQEFFVLGFNSSPILSLSLQEVMFLDQSFTSVGSNLWSASTFWVMFDFWLGFSSQKNVYWQGIDLLPFLHTSGSSGPLINLNSSVIPPVSTSLATWCSDNANTVISQLT